MEKVVDPIFNQKKLQISMDNKKHKREVEYVVLSDIHLGTYGCQSKDLLKYLKSIQPKVLILNGDIIDIWQFNKRYWPKSHMKVVKQIINWITQGVKVYYITGNHDELLRKFEGFELENFSIKNKLLLDINGQKTWFFHGDVFDVVMKHSKWLAKLGGIGYDILILINTFINFISYKFNGKKFSLSKKIKNSVKSAINFIDDFEQTVVQIAMSNDYNTVVCGHIHQPKIKDYTIKGKKVKYLNSGDWIENETALEYHDKKWSIYHFKKEDYIDEETEKVDIVDKSSKTLYKEMLAEFMYN